MKSQIGVTLIELIITLAVAAILTSLALPSFRQAMVSNRLTSINNEFMGAINFVRAEAIKRGQSITLCKSTTGNACSTVNTTFWENGWIAFADNNANGDLDVGEAVLQVWPSLPQLYTLRSTTFSDFIRYTPQGATTTTGSFAVCHNSEEEGAKAVIITRLRPRIAEDSNNDSIPETDAANINSCESP